MFFKLLLLLFCSMLTLSGLELLSQNTAVLEQNYDSGDDDTTKVNVLLRLGENFCSRENKKALFLEFDT